MPLSRSSGLPFDRDCNVIGYLAVMRRSLHSELGMIRVGNSDFRAMYALVLWCGGSDNGKRSVVNTKKIRNFDENKFLDGEITSGDEFAVEWGTGRAPKGGFPIYMAKVLKIADRESTLSAYPSFTEDSDEFISGEDNEEDDRPSKRQSIPKKFFDDTPTKDAPTKVAPVNRNNNKDKAAAKQLQHQQIAASQSQCQGSEKDKATEEIQLLRHELQELKNFVFSELPKISQQVQEMTARPELAPAAITSICGNLSGVWGYGPKKCLPLGHAGKHRYSDGQDSPAWSVRHRNTRHKQFKRWQSQGRRERRGTPGLR
ncbi:hypothetical protein GJAV_G00060900 [Gymnothorax javanicus]|nr:hypothetical protein GJAV_G00060900 [Gymnothorax javanicus]